MSNVRFIVNTIEREQEIAAMVSEYVEFFQKNTIRFTWPVKSVEEEYDAKKYEAYTTWLETEWAKQEQGFTERLLTFFHRPADLQFTPTPESSVGKGGDERRESAKRKAEGHGRKPVVWGFTVEVSNYGPLGFYDERSNTVTINRNTDRDPVETIKHEMVHIMLEPFISKYRVGHTRKESIVDAVLKILV